VAPVGDPDGTAETEPALGEVQSIADGATHAVVRAPADQRGVDAALQDQVLDQPAHLVVDQRGDHGRAEAEAAPQAAGDVVLAAALPYPEGPGGPDAPLAGVEPSITSPSETRS
jgi:hypothetical protein